MSVRNHNWYALQATRRYPLDDNSTGLDDANNLIRDDILVDCHIRFPSTYGQYVCVQGLTVAPGIVTVVFGVSDKLDAGAAVVTPLAAVTVPRPVSVNVNYAVTALQPGVSGWAVFGPGITTNFVGRYTTVQQALVSPRCARPYRPLPIPTIGKLGLTTALQGVVRLIGTAPVKVSYVQNAGRIVRVIDGQKTVHRDATPALVVELDLDQITATYNPLKEFLGPCAARPESGNCPKPPIESINGLKPDLSGNIDIKFENFAEVERFRNCGGLVIRHDKDLVDVCSQAATPRRPYTNNCCAAIEVGTEQNLKDIPKADRVANMIVTTLDTNERWKLAADLETWSITDDEYGCLFPDPTNLIPDVIIDETSGTGPLSMRSRLYAKLPLHINFNNPAIAADTNIFRQRSGRFEHTNAGTYASKHGVGLNVATLTGAPTDWAVGKAVTTELVIGGGGGEKNGGLVLNYRVGKNAVHQSQTTFIAVVLDAVLGQLRVLRYTNSFVTVEAAIPFVVATTPCTNCYPQYRLTATTIDAGDSVALLASVEQVVPVPARGRTASVTVQLTKTAYGEPVGEPGLFANGSLTSFTNLTIADP